MKNHLIGSIITMAAFCTVMYGLFKWDVAKNRKYDVLCEVALQKMDEIDTLAKALAVGLSVNALIEAEATDRLASTGDHMRTEDIHTDATAQVDSLAYVQRFGSQGIAARLTRPENEQRMPIEIAREVNIAEKAVSAACNR